MHAKIQRWGNSLGLRIPKSVAAGVGVKVDSVVDLSVDGDKIVIRPVRRVRYDLDELLRDVTPENLHGEVDIDGPVGREIW